MKPVDQIADFVAKALAEGKSRKEISAVLLSAGWAASEVDAAQAAWAEAAFEVPVPRPRPHISAREAFFHAILFAALLTSSWFIVDLGFELIGYWLPDLDGQTWYYDHWSVRWNIAALTVAMPTFLFLDQVSLRAVRRDAGSLRSGVRKWFGYVTLLLAALTLAVDVVVALYTFLNGAYSAAVAARLALVAATAGLIFTYFLTALRESAGATRTMPELLARIGLVGLVGALLVAAISEVGGPVAAQRERRDMARLDDLQGLSRVVRCIADLDSGVLPAAIKMDAACYPASRTVDPFTNVAYLYTPLSPRTFRLCAEFERLDILKLMDVYSADDVDDATGCLTETYFPPESVKN